ncbi:MAG: FAD-dependent oxidoreductase [Verrucomicrobia bacterium]|nr:FAD-dependent oxidoreductase [Verrucomicrobiota bacterium]
MKSWRCIVCGYVHHGDQPPDLCPVCGAPSSDFEEVIEPPAPAAAEPATAWRCLVCGYVHAGSEPPPECPLCGAPASSFEAAQESPPEIPGAAGSRRIVILGAGIAGVSAAEAARKASPDSHLVLLSRENELPYYRLNLTRFLARDVEESALPLHPAGWYEENGIELLTGAEAVSIGAPGQDLELADGKRMAFDRLIIASGAHAFVPPLPGSGLEGVFTLRTLEDARGLVQAVQPGLHCVCIGGGILGLETAGALAQRGAGVTLLESHISLMPRQLNRQAGELLGRYVEGIGIRLRTQARTKELAGPGRVQQVVLEDGARLDADVVVIATGVRSNTHLARGAGLDVHQGILINSHLQTSRPDILAAGDVAEHQGVLYGAWHAAQYQGSMAGTNAAGGHVEFGGLPRSHTLKVLGLGMTSIGQFEPADGSYRIIEQAQGEGYQRFVFRDALLVGAVLLGDTRLAAAASHAIEKRRDFSALLSTQADVRAVAEQLA